MVFFYGIMVAASAFLSLLARTEEKEDPLKETAPTGIVLLGLYLFGFIMVLRSYSPLPRCENQFFSSSLFFATVSLNASVFSSRSFSLVSFAI